MLYGVSVLTGIRSKEEHISSEIGEKHGRFRPSTHG